MKYAIIVAGGVGSRSGDSLPKQFHQIAGHPMLWWTLRAFHEEDPDTRLIVVMHKDYVDLWDEIKGEDCAQHSVVIGGSTRTASVDAGLGLVPDEAEGLVAVHDAARPLASKQLIGQGWECAAKYKAVIPGVAVSDSLREGTKEESHSVDRSRFFSVQTPQVFDISLLKEAYRKAQAPQPPEGGESGSDCQTMKTDTKRVAFTDDASVVEWYGHPVRIYDGDPRNIKVTYPGDFQIAETYLNAQCTIHNSQ